MLPTHSLENVFESSAAIRFRRLKHSMCVGHEAVLEGSTPFMAQDNAFRNRDGVGLKLTSSGTQEREVSPWFAGGFCDVIFVNKQPHIPGPWSFV